MEQNFKIAVPEGCAAKVEKQDVFLVVVFEQKKEEKWVPKDGDIYTTSNDGVGIYSGRYKAYGDIIPAYCGLRNDGALCIRNDEIDNDSGFGNFMEIRPATEEDKKRLFDALAKKGKRWNAEEKRIEDLPRWRARKGEIYYYVDYDFTIDYFIEDEDSADNTNYVIGNYYKTREAAERAAEKIRKIFKESEAE